ncbi:MAG: ABC transporter permease subunit [Bacilli bacterium]|nr:ABC transporter permease subunit [Bacilli bacterium]
MIIRVVRHELKLVWSRFWVLLLVVAFIAGALTLLSHIPDFYETIVTEARPDGVVKAELLNQYRAALEALDPTEKSKIALLNFFLKTNTDQFEYFELANITTHYLGAESLATSYSFIEGAALLTAPLGIVLGLLLFVIPSKNGSIQMELSSGIKRSSLLFGKIIVGFSALLLYCLIAVSVSLIAAKDNLNQLFLFAYRDGYASATFSSLLGMKSLGMLTGGVFYFAVSSLLGIVLPRSYLGPSILFAVFLLCFLFSNVEMPKWGYYGEPSGLSLKTLFLIPFSNVFLASNFGFLGESAIVSAVYLLLTAGLVSGLFVYIKKANV